MLSLFFYGWWNASYLMLLIGTIVINYLIGSYIASFQDKPRLRLLILVAGLILNIGILAYYKYTGFILENINSLTELNLPIFTIILPLGISFFTFQQIAYLADTYRNESTQHSFKEYALFVSFFPQLIAGPIVNHKDFFYQIRHKRFMKWSHFGFAVGLSFFIVGLFKKVVIADRLSMHADILFAENIDHSILTVFDYWIGISSYTLQIYFDFSGYTDMAIGLARMFGVKLPVNFNSPYHSSSIIEFWRRWHITLSDFLKYYLYIPLGGNRKGELRKYNNLIATMALGGLWHGAGFTFIVWGIIHGVYLSINNIWKKTNLKLNKYLAVIITFICVLASWVPFRAISMEQSLSIWRGLFLNTNFNVPVLYDTSRDSLFSVSANWAFLLIIGFIVIFYRKNSNTFPLAIYKKKRYSIILSLMMILSIVSMSDIKPFIYFQF